MLADWRGAAKHWGTSDPSSAQPVPGPSLPTHPAAPHSQLRSPAGVHAGHKVLSVPQSALASEPPTNVSFMDNGVLQHRHSQRLCQVKKKKLLTGAQSRQKAKIIGEPFCPAHPHPKRVLLSWGRGQEQPAQLCCPCALNDALLLQLKKGDWARALGHFHAPRITEVMAAHLTNWSSH